MPCPRRVAPVLAVMLGLLAGCDADSGGGPPPCRVARATCRFGLLSASCGPAGPEARFACEPTDGRCAWFSSECLPEGFEPSVCPASDVCCVDGYPFDASWREPIVSDTRVHDFLFSWGTAPWDDAREANVVVTVDPTLPGGPLAFSCTGAVPVPAGACDAAASLMTFSAVDVAFALAIRDARGDLSGWNLWIEIVGARARVCRVSWTDGVVFSCTGVPGPDCATSGTLVLSRDASAGAAGTHGHLEASLASGTSVSVTF